MVRKRKSAIKDTSIIFCFYCDRVFQDETTLILHQKGKHWKCTECNKKLHSASGMSIHMYQVHKVSITTVPNAKPDRESMDWEIFGMAGVPEGMKPGGPVPEDNRSAKAQRTGEAPPQPQLPPPGALPGHHYSHVAAPGYPHVQGPAHHPPPPYMMPPMGYSAPPYSMPSPYGFPPGMAPYVPHSAPLIPLPASQPQRAPPGLPQAQPSQPLASNGTPGAARPASGGPLFPIASAEPAPQGSSVPPATGVPLPPQPGGAVLQPHLAAQSGVPAAALSLSLVWSDEQYSMEERRAQHMLSRGHAIS